MDTLSDAVRRLQAQGYTGNWFATPDHKLACDETGEVVDPADVVIDHILRFEGQSDPGDMTILFALQAPSGQKGVYSAAFGANTSTDDVEVMARMQHRPADGTLDE
jgi:hypothetical protein